MDFFRARVLSVRQETKDAVSICFDAKELYAHFDPFVPGQHLTLKLTIQGKEVRRSYSIASMPQEAELCITIKQVKKGLASNHLTQHIKAGDFLEISKPEGHFAIQPDSENSRAYYFFAAGSGITPVHSMVCSLLEYEPKSTVHLLYGNRKEEYIIFYDSLKKLQQRYAGQFHVEFTLSQSGKSFLPFLSSSKDTWSGWKGRINRPMIDRFLENYPSRSQEKFYYICGPGQMIEDVKKALMQSGVDSKHIHAEYFTTPAGSASKSSAGPVIEKAHIKVHLNGKMHALEIPGNKKILDSLMDAGLDAPYSCCSGACSTCMAKIIQGTVHMESALALEEDEIKAGYILTCQSRPTSEELEIKY